MHCITHAPPWAACVHFAAESPLALCRRRVLLRDYVYINLAAIILRRRQLNDWPRLRIDGQHQICRPSIDRLEQAAELLDIKVTGKKCKGMEGVIAEGAEALDEEGDEHILDLGIIGAGSRVEHYEMAGYTTAINLAKKLGNEEVVDLLTQNLEEEQAADEKLRTIGDQILEQAPTEQDEDSDESEDDEDAGGVEVRSRADACARAATRMEDAACGAGYCVAGEA